MDTYSLCRQAAAEGAVLLKNDHHVLPLKVGTTVAVFGRAQTFYYKSGTGSGGLVHIEHEPCMIESLKANPDLVLDQDLMARYAAWVEDHPFDNGGGVWASEPWFQEEMPIDDVVVEAAAQRNEAAVIVLARSSGEDHDNADEPGSYRLTAAEETLIATVTRHFEKVIVALNVGNLIDTSFMKKYPVSALLYIWQGGMAGADAFADLLSGRAAPCGKLTDTAVWDLADHPAHDHFGNRDKSVYTEDVYVGYRWFETFDQSAVQYPFGYGLTYTNFAVTSSAREENGTIVVSATVENIGERAGREVVEVYVQSPCGQLGNPSKRLVAFAKTALLQPSESETLTITFELDDAAVYDDGGVTGYRSCYVLEEGAYTVFVGTDVRSTSAVYTHTIEKTVVVKQLREALAPVEAFDRVCAVETDGIRKQTYCPVPVQTVDLKKRIVDDRPADIAFVGDCGIRLCDVASGKHTLEEFIAQLSDGDLAALSCGEGMNSPKATPGTGGALGGQTERLSAFGIPVCCVTDGPSGIRLDSGEKASLLPNGTLLACTWDTALVEKLYERVGEELKSYAVDALLGPGINIHRYPLCGRNFEYFSEDPILTGKIAAAVTRGVAKYGAYATIKHFAANNQETGRYACESVVSERALREIYLKPFEIAVKEGANILIMTAYNPINGYWTASNYDLTKTILRDEWGFDNFVMTDWWVKCNLECHGEGNGALLQAMVRAVNDVNMVCTDAQVKAQSILEGLANGYITRGELQRCTANILRWIMKSNTFAEYVENGCVAKYPVTMSDEGMTEKAVFELPVSDETYEVVLNAGAAMMELCVRSDTDALAQTPITVQCGHIRITCSVCGTGGEFVVLKRRIDAEEAGAFSVKATYPDVVTVKTIIVKQ